MVVFGSFARRLPRSRGASGPLGGRPRGFSAGVQDRQAACAVQLEQVVDHALEAPLSGWLAAAQHPAGVLDGLDLAEPRLYDRLAPAVDLAALLGRGLAPHPLLRGGVLRDRPARRRRRWLVVLETAGRDVRIDAVLLAGLHVLLGEVTAVGGQHRPSGSSAPTASRF